MSAAEPTGSGRQRTLRSDSGQVRATERDALGMSWVADMYGMPFDLLKRQLDATEGAARNMIGRWRRAGWAESGRIGGEPLTTWVWATRLGCEMFGRRPYAAHRPSAGSLNHHRAVVEVRLALEEELGDRLIEYRSERELRWELGQRRGSDAARAHLPDGVASYTQSDGTVIVNWVLEVELTPKSFERIERILDTLFGEYREPTDVVAYYVTKRAAPLVARAKDAFERKAPVLGNRLRIRPLPGEEPW